MPAVACFDTAFHADHPARGRHLRAARRSGASAGTCAGSASTASPTPTRRAGRRSSSADRPRPAPRHLPPRRRRLAGRRPRTAARSTPRWASRRSTAWSWRPARAASIPGSSSGSRSTSACRRPSWPRRSSTARACSAWRARPTCARCSAASAAAMPPPRSPLGVYLHRLRGAHRGDGGRPGRPRRPGLHRRRRRALARDPRRAPPAVSAFLGVALDAGANASGEGDREISAGGAAVRTLVIEAREDLEIAGQVRQVVTSPGD